MAECIIEEYVRLGWDERRLLSIFANPMFLATHRIYRQKGEGYVRQLIREYIIDHAGNRELPAWLLKAAQRRATPK